MKKTICLILALVLCIGLLAACGDKKTEDNNPPVDPKPTEKVNTAGSSTEDFQATPPPAEAKYAETLTYMLDDKVALVDPFNAGSVCPQMGYPYHLIYDTLINYTLQGTYEPCLATEWEPNEDYTVFKFKLRDDVVFHNGEKFTSDDVKFTIERGWTDDALGAPVYDVASKIDHVDCPSDYELVITLKESNYDFFYDCTNIVKFPICNREAVEADPTGWGPMIGTGPFVMKEFVSSESFTCTRNDDYFGEKPYTETMIFRYIAEETARYLMFDNDEADFVVINSAYIPEYMAKEGVTMTSNVVNNCGYVSMNCTKAPLDDVNLRLAIAYAINDEDIVELGFAGYSQTHDTGALWGWTSAYKDTSIAKRTQDLDKAQEYLAKSKYNNEKLQIAASMPHTKRIAAVVQAQLTAIGINCEVYECDGPTLTAQTMWGSNDLDMVVNSMMFSPLADSVRLAVTENNSNKANWINEEAKELALQAAVTPDGPEREAMYHRIQELMYEEVPYITTTHNVLYTATHEGTGGVLYFASAYNDASMAYRIVE